LEFFTTVSPARSFRTYAGVESRSSTGISRTWKEKDGISLFVFVISMLTGTAEPLKARFGNETLRVRTLRKALSDMRPEMMIRDKRVATTR